MNFDYEYRNQVQAIYKWQKGAALPIIDNLVILAAVFKVTIDDILVTTNKVKMQNTA